MLTLHNLGPFSFEDRAQVFRQRHRPDCADIGAARVADRHPDLGEHQRCDGACALTEDFAQVAPQPADVPHADVALHVQPGQALTEDVCTFEMLEGERQVAGAARLLCGGPFLGEGGANRCGHDVSVDVVADLLQVLR